MKLTIDTKTDSKDEIRKAIRLLAGLIGGQEVYTNEQKEEKKEQPNIFESQTPALGNMMSIFDTPSTGTNQTIEEEETKEQETPKLEFY